MIVIENLTKKFNKLSVINVVNLILEKGECIALIGPNGCGKTTLIKSILGMVIPTSGNILYNGVSVLENINYRKNIGFMPQIGKYPENMTIGHVFKMVKEIRQYKDPFDEDLFYQFELDKILDKKMRTLSGGTTQKVSATLAFLFNPDVLILDEPTAGLDPLASEILKNKIKIQKQKGKLILITSHLLSELDDLVSQIIFMQEGNVLFKKSLDELMIETGMDKLSNAIVYLLKNRKN